MTTSSSPPAQEPIDLAVRSLIPARLDRLPWALFHTRMVAALGSCWILDGLEITIVSNVSDQLGDGFRLGLSHIVIILLAPIYLLGQVVGALTFGQISDRFGRKRLFFLTLGVYFAGNALTVLTLGSGAGWIAFLFVTRLIAGAGIGGEYTAINSAIDEMVPPPYRGRTDIIVNGTYWAGAAIAAAIQIPLLSGKVSPTWDWRIAFLIGPALALLIFFLRRSLPESPRWQIMHGYSKEAVESIRDIELRVERTTQRKLVPVKEERRIEIRQTPKAGYPALLRVLFKTYPGRSMLGATLMITQSFLFNAIFFSYATVLSHFYHVLDADTAVYYIPFALGSFLGPLLLGQLFDTIGRRVMIAGTYLLSGTLLALTAFLFQANVLNAATQTIAWCVIFFFASAGASAAYLTVSELFPMEVRAKAIAVFFAIAQIFGSVAPIVYGLMIGSKEDPSRTGLFWAYILGAVVMIFGGAVAAILGVAAERKSLEDVATPLSVLPRTTLGGLAAKTDGAGLDQ